MPLLETILGKSTKIQASPGPFTFCDLCRFWQNNLKNVTKSLKNQTKRISKIWQILTKNVTMFPSSIFSLNLVVGTSGNTYSLCPTGNAPPRYYPPLSAPPRDLIWMRGTGKPRFSKYCGASYRFGISRFSSFFVPIFESYLKSIHFDKHETQNIFDKRQKNVFFSKNVFPDW